MSSADEVIAAIDEGKSHLEQASASFANARQLAEQLSSAFAGLNADGKAAEAAAVATILGDVESASPPQVAPLTKRVARQRR